MNENQKKTWASPEVVVYGDINTLTQGGAIEPKQLGSIDDFAVQGISDP